MKVFFRRLLAAGIDLYLIGIVCFLFDLFSKKLFNYDIQIELIYILFPFKDLVFRDRSIGKKILGLKVETLNGDKPSLIVMILRNITTSLYFLEILLIFIFNKRLTDVIFKTQVVYLKNSVQEKPIINFKDQNIKRVVFICVLIFGLLINIKMFISSTNLNYKNMNMEMICEKNDDPFSYKKVILTGYYEIKSGNKIVTKQDIYQKETKLDANEAREYYEQIIKLDNCYNQKLSDNIVEFNCFDNLSNKEKYKEFQDKDGNLSFSKFKEFYEESGYVCQ